MRILLDTHTLLWWLTTPARLSPAIRRNLSSPATQGVVSAASAWELAIKVKLGKLAGAEKLVANFVREMETENLEILSMTVTHALRAGSLPGPNQDFFDRMLLAQAQEEDLPIASDDPALDGYGVRRIW